MDGWTIVAAAAGAIALVAAGLVLWTRRIVSYSEKKFPPQGKFIYVDSIRLHYVERGSGPAVILLHGDGGSSYDYLLSPLVALLAKNYRVLVFDRPGLGYSQRSPGSGSAAAQARCIHAAAKQLGVGKAVMVGHSRGALVALAYGLNYAEDTLAVVSLAGAYSWDPAKMPWFTKLLLVPMLGPLLAHTLYVPFGRGLTELALTYAFRPERMPPSEYAEAYTAMNLRPYHLLSAAGGQGKSWAEMWVDIPAGINFPVPLVIAHGTDDLDVSFMCSQRLHQEIPGSLLLPFQGGSHQVIYTRAEEVCEAISQAMHMGLARVAGARPRQAVFSPLVSAG